MAKVEHAVSVGDRFEGSYKDTTFGLEAVTHNEKVAFKVTNPADFDAPEATGRVDVGIFRSPSAAAGALTGSKSINGWSFWKPEGSLPNAPKAKAGKKAKAKKAKAEDSAIVEEETEEEPEEVTVEA